MDGIGLLVQPGNVVGHPVPVHVTAYHAVHPYGRFTLFLVFYKFISHFLFALQIDSESEVKGERNALQIKSQG